MGEYLITVAFVSSAVGVLEFLFYRSRGGGAARFCACVILTHAIIAPALSLAASLPDRVPLLEDVEMPDIPHGDTFGQIAEEGFEEGVCKLLCANFGFDEENVSASAVGFEPSEMRAERIVVLLSGSAALSDYKSVEAYLNGLSIGNCEVRIRIG